MADTDPSPEDIDAALVRRLVDAQFPRWAGLSIVPVEHDGWDNRTFRLGRHMSVRLPSAARYAAKVPIEQKWLPIFAPHLPLPIPVPLAMGSPADGYPWHWSIYRWLDGQIASVAPVADLNRFAATLVQFLTALQQIDPVGGPRPGQHNFYRGGSLTVYDAETWAAIEALQGEIDTTAAAAVWQAALNAPWDGRPLWLHGDVAATNLLVKNGRLNAVIDFGGMAVGDPACDLTIAWTFLSGQSREIFRAAMPADDATWARARGWALWKALITVAGHSQTNPLIARNARHVIDEVLADHRRFTSNS